MKTLIVILIIGGLGYFAYQVMHNSDAVTQESATERQIREAGLEDIEETIPRGTQDALITVDNDIDKFFLQVREKIQKWRIEINTYINARL